MKEMFFRNLARPLLERLGTMFAAWLVMRGLDSDLVAQLVNALVALVAVSAELVLYHVNRGRDITRFINEAGRYENVLGLRRGDD
ncbi:MAG: hypothetical protein LCH86_14825 [Proteobacteria bacterium]|nr:hypothetical protein [Pseudomonadota bacterium]